MLRAIVQFSMSFRAVVIGLAGIVVVYGLWAAAHTKFDVFPEFAPPQVVIQTEAPGLSSEQVEALVTGPVETGVSGVSGLASIRSQSIDGLSVVIATFREGTEVLSARQMISERLTQITERMPLGVRPPRMAPLTSSTSLVLSVGLTSGQRSPMELRTIADWTVRPRLLAVEGVANVIVFGGDVRQLQVQLLPERLLAYDLAVSDVVAAARMATGVLGAGFVETANQRIAIRTEGQSLTAGDLGKTVISHRDGVSVRLEDVARVVDAAQPKVGDAAVNGLPGVVLLVWSQFGANTLEVTAAVDRTLDELRPALASQSVTLDPSLFRPADFIITSIRGLQGSLLLGGLLVAAVLYFFMLDLRTAFISFTAIPISLLAAITVLDRFGESINTITLGGLAIAVGVVVDDAIIDVENVVRRLRENQRLGRPRSPFRVMLDASLEVRSAVVYATFVVALVFVPVLGMSGVQGRLFAPLATSFILATLASLLVALTVTPALCRTLLAEVVIASEPRYIVALKRIHLRCLKALTQRAGWVAAIALVLCLAAAAALPFFGGEFLPEFREGNFIIHMSAVPGTSAQESMRVGRQVAVELLQNPRIRSVAQQVGRAELGEDTVGTDFSEFVVALQPGAAEEAETVQSEIREVLAKFPGMVFAVKTFLSERIEEVISGTTAPLAVKIYGDDLDVIDQKAREVAQVIGAVDGAVDVRVQAPPGEPQLVVRLRHERLAELGFRPVEVLEAVQASYQGLMVAQVYERGRTFDVVVILDEAARREPESVSALTVRDAGGTRMPLRELAYVFLTTGRHMILHEGTRRQQTILCNVRGRDLASFVAEAKDRVRSEVAFPAGVYPVFTGTAEAERQARREIILRSAIAGAGIVLLLAIIFRNVPNLLLVLTNLPFAVVGGVLAVLGTGGWLSVGSLVGFVTLFGITTRNSIMMMTHYEHLVTVEGSVWGVDAVLRGASERLVPIVMTALVTALGLLPIALGSGAAGREIEGPMAVVILGGLVTSTALNLFVLPALALRFGLFTNVADETQ